MSRHVHDGGEVVSTTIDYDFVEHYDSDEPGLLVVRGVPALTCRLCDEHWFNEDVGFDLVGLLVRHAPGPGEISTIDWLGNEAA
jgi:hypothetical protein